MLFHRARLTFDYFTEQSVEEPIAIHKINNHNAQYKLTCRSKYGRKRINHGEYILLYIIIIRTYINTKAQIDCLRP